MADETVGNPQFNAEELLEQILAVGKDLVKQGQEHTGDLTVKGKELASKGEDYLVDKLGVEDTDVLGVLAYKAHKAGKMPKSADDVIGLLKGPKANERSDVLLRAMISAAKADGSIHEDELEMIRVYDSTSVNALQSAMGQKSNPKAIAALADSDQAAAEIYAVSCRVANGLNPMERDYLDQLAMGLKLDPELAARIETDVRTG